MTRSQVVVPEPVPGRFSPSRRPDVGWLLLGWVGAVFTVVGLTDIVLAWLPPALGNGEWEFGTISRTFDSLPLPFIGMALVTAAGVARGLLWQRRVAAVVMAVLGALVVASLVIYATNIPLALRSVQLPVAKLGIRKAILKALVQGVCYPVAAIATCRIGFGREGPERGKTEVVPG
jgi:hypothetical protein